MEGRFLGRDIINKPSCPFCGGIIDKPKELFIRMPTEMPVGQCPCGAVYSCDVTGHNLGTAMIEALVVACNGDWDLAFDLLPEDDYLEKQVEHYDIETHLVVHSGVYEGRHINGTLYFIRPHEDIREVTEEGARRLIENATPAVKHSSSLKRDSKNFSKREVEALVKDYQMDALLELAGRDKRIIRDLQRLLLSVDLLTRYRAAEAMGKVCALIAQKDPGFISRRLQGLFTSVTDTAASSWGYIGAIGEIICHNPGQFAGYIPELYRLMNDRALMPEVLNALWKIAQSKREAIRKNTFHFIPLLMDSDPEIRGSIAILLGHLRANETKDELSKLLEDAAAIQVYRDGIIENLTVGQLAFEAIEKLST
ncbi:DVU0298 family protein [Thermodesulfobacteriota bacterium]